MRLCRYSWQDGNGPATIGCSIRNADGASYFRVEDWIATDNFNANTIAFARIFNTQYYYGSGL